jgi:hypothetical protein
MPDVQEVFRMATQKVRPEPGFVDRQHDNQRRRARNRRFAAMALVAALGLGAAIVVMRAARDGSETQPVIQPVQTPVEIATGFLDAYGAFDADRAISYLAADADIQGLITAVSSGAEGRLEELRRVMSLLKAQEYEQALEPCEELSSSTSETSFRCSVDFQLLGSSEIGLGPYGGSFFDVTVRDGKVVRVSVQYRLLEFVPEMWEPFAEWVSRAHPEDAAIMYVDATYSEGRLSEASIRLWDRYVDGYVAYVKGTSGG